MRVFEFLFVPKKESIQKESWEESYLRNLSLGHQLKTVQLNGFFVFVLINRLRFCRRNFGKDRSLDNLELLVIRVTYSRAQFKFKALVLLS